MRSVIVYMYVRACACVCVCVQGWKYKSKSYLQLFGNFFSTYHKNYESLFILISSDSKLVLTVASYCIKNSLKKGKGPKKVSLQIHLQK